MKRKLAKVLLIGAFVYYVYHKGFEAGSKFAENGG